MKKLFSFAIFFLLLNSQFTQAQEPRVTSFENRQVCESTKGIWREFGNNCVDSCEKKLDENHLCANSITFGCDCGPNSCWQDDKCVSISSYKKIYAEEVKKNEEELAKIAKERDELVKNDPNLRAYLLNLYAKKDNPQAAQPNNAQNNNQQANQAGQQNQQAQAPITLQPYQGSEQLIATQPQSGPQIMQSQSQQQSQQQSSPMRDLPPAFLAQEKGEQQQPVKEAIDGDLQFPTLQIPQ